MKDNLRLESHPILLKDSVNWRPVTIMVDEVPISAFEGESLAAALWANRIFSLRRDETTGAPRGLYCGIGHCYECRVTVDGVKDIRACLAAVREGMVVSLNGSKFFNKDDKIA